MQKTKDRATLKIKGEPCTPEGQPVFAPLVITVVLLLLQIR
jgi:hypothetical protein